MNEDTCGYEDILYQQLTLQIEEIVTSLDIIHQRRRREMKGGSDLSCSTQIRNPSLGRSD